MIIHLKFHAFPALEINPKYWQLSHLDFDLILCSIVQGEPEIIWDKLKIVTAKMESTFHTQSNNLHIKNIELHVPTQSATIVSLQIRLEIFVLINTMSFLPYENFRYQ